MWSKCKSALLAAGVLLLVESGECTINQYDHEPLVNNFLIYRKNAMFGMDDAPYVQAESKDPKATISFKLDFEFPSDVASDEDALVQLSVFPLDAYQYIGVDVNNSSERLFCCTKEMAKEGKICQRPNSLIIQDRAPEGMIQTWPAFPDVVGETTKRLVGSYDVKEKGFYYLVISFCNDKVSQVEISGQTRWENPFGFLPGEVYGFLPFYYHMSLAYLFTAMLWAFLCAKHWRDLLMIQNWMTCVIAFGLIEVYLRYYDFYHFNTYGDRSKGIMFGSVFFLCLKKTVSRLLVLMVSMGFGVVKPTLGEAWPKILVAGAAYFGFSCIQLTVENLSHTHSLTFSGYLLVLPVICLDFLFFLWIFSSLSQIVTSLDERRQETKLNLYLRFRRVLGLCVSSGVVWSFLFSYCIMSNWAETHWETFYQLEAFWDVLYYAILVMILYLWAPSSNSNRYAYDRVSTWDHDDEEYGEDLEDVVAVRK